jgi:hypothetical protein
MTLATPDSLGLDPLPEGVDITNSPPEEVDWTTSDGVFVKSVHVRNAGSFMRQHAHTHDHTSMIASGAVFLWKDGKLDKQYHAPALIKIDAGVWHTFQTLKDDTTILCIHRLGNEILEKHGLTEADL